MDKEPYVRKFEGLQRSKLLGISQTILSCHRSPQLETLISGIEVGSYVGIATKQRDCQNTSLISLFSSNAAKIEWRVTSKFDNRGQLGGGGVVGG